MRKVWTIIKAEYGQVVKKKSFVFGIIFTPVFLILVSTLPAMFAQRGVSTPVSYAVIDLDGRGIGAQFAESLRQYTLSGDSTREAYDLQQVYALAPDDNRGLDSLRATLDTAVQAKRLKYYVIIFPRAELTDSVMMVSKAISITTSSRFERRISNILAGIRLENSNINLPIDSVLKMSRRIEMLQASPGGKSRDFMAVYLGAFIFVMIIFSSVIGFGQVLMRSVIEEKGSRIMEVLVSSVSPFQLMMGKVIGLGAANLTQIAVWVAMGVGLYMMRGSIPMPAEVSGAVFNPLIIAFFVVFLIIAYLMYSSLFAFVGSICTTDKEAQNFMFPIIMSLLLPVFLMMYIIQEPDSPVTLALSLVPFFTPTMMMARLNVIAPETFSLADPLILEACLGVIISGAFTVLIIWMTARVFRIGILMYGKRATLPEILRWVRHA